MSDLPTWWTEADPSAWTVLVAVLLDVGPSIVRWRWWAQPRTLGLGLVRP